LVGRHWNYQTNRCDYVLRNTRGTAADFSKVQGPYYLVYKDGYITVNRQYLRDFGGGIYYLNLVSTRGLTQSKVF